MILDFSCGASDQVHNPPKHWLRAGYIETPIGHRAATVFKHKLTALIVLVSKSRLTDQTEWWHVSVSYPDRIPDWEIIRKVRDEFLGENVEAYQVIPKKVDYVNLHHFCLHLWAPVDGNRRVANLQDLEWEDAI